MAAYCGVPHAIGVALGHRRARARARARSVSGPAPRSLTTPFSFFATASTIVRARRAGRSSPTSTRATLNLDPGARRPTRSRRRATESSASCPCTSSAASRRCAPLGALAARHGLWLVEDAAQAIGARDGRRRRGRLRARRLPLVLPDEEPGRHRRRRHGAHRRRRARRARPPERHQGQASALRARLARRSARGSTRSRRRRSARSSPHLDGWNAAPARDRRAGTRRALASAGLAGGARRAARAAASRPARRTSSTSTSSARAIGTRSRAHLDGSGDRHAGVLSAPAPPAAGARAGRRRRPAAFPEAERAAAEVLALPIYPELTDAQVGDGRGGDRRASTASLTPRPAHCRARGASRG